MARVGTSGQGAQRRTLIRNPQSAIHNSRPPWQERSGPVGTFFKGLLWIVLALVMLFPFVYVIAVSFSSYKDVAAGGVILFPKNPTLAAYRAVLGNGIVARALWVSVGVTLIGTLLDMVMTVTLADGLSKQ